MSGRTSDARERLLESATELFYAQGYSAVGVKALCEHARVTKGSFYHFFPSKRALAMDVIKQYDDWFSGLLRQAMSEDLAAPERLERLFQLIYQHHRSMQEATGQMQGCLVGNLALETRGQDRVLLGELQRTFKTWITSLEELANLEPADAEAILAYLEGIALLATTGNDPELFKRLGSRAIRLAGAQPAAS